MVCTQVVGHMEPWRNGAGRVVVVTAMVWVMRSWVDGGMVAAFACFAVDFAAAPRVAWAMLWACVETSGHRCRGRMRREKRYGARRDRGKKSEEDQPSS